MHTLCAPFMAAIVQGCPVHSLHRLSLLLCILMCVLMWTQLCVRVRAHADAIVRAGMVGVLFAAHAVRFKPFFMKVCQV